MEKTRWGIIGPGIIARQFANDFKHVRHGKLVAVASRSGSRAEQFAEEFQIPRHYGAYDNLYKDPDVDAIYVATPHNFHFEQSAAALRSGKAVLCEKPLTHTLRQTLDLIDVSKATGNYLMEGMWTWFLPAVKKAREWFDQGRIGPARHIRASFGYPLEYDPEHRGYNPDLAGGVLLDMGIYTLAITRLFIGKDPVNMQVVARKATTGVDDDVSMLLEYEEALASLATSFRVKLPNQAFISGEKGSIAIPDFWRARECFLYEGDKLKDHFTDDREGFGFNYEIDAVSRDLMEGKPGSDVVDHRTTLWLATTMEQLMNKF
jgi:predicted dehydrogenase